jgi:IS66 C-terminal element/Transposase IS66 family
MPYLRATMIGDVPGCRLSAAISRFCSAVQRRRRSPRVITSIGRRRALVRSLVGASSDSSATSSILSSSLKDNSWPDILPAAQRGAEAPLTRWQAFTRFLDDGRICLTNNAAERALRGIAIGRKAWLFAGSDRGGERAAAMYSLIATAKLNDVDPRAWLADVLARIADHPASRLDELLPWHWPRRSEDRSLAA